MGGKPISAIPYIDTIINTLSDKFYVVVKIGDAYIRHFRHKDTAIRMHCLDYYNIDTLYEYIRYNFENYDRIDFTSDSSLIWVKENWRGDNIPRSKANLSELLKIIVDEIYEPKTAQHMLQSINGVIANIYSKHKTASEEELYHYARVRYETDPKYREGAIPNSV